MGCPCKYHMGPKMDMPGLKRAWYMLAITCPLKSQCKPTKNTGLSPDMGSLYLGPDISAVGMPDAYL